MFRLRPLYACAPLLALLLTACGTTPSAPPRVETGEPAVTTEPSRPTPPVTPSRPSEPERTSTTPSSLLAKADSARTRGDYDQALAILERAQRIDPDDADIYLQMARTHAAAGHAGKARTVAERGLLYCSGSAQCNALRAFID
ncbi:tetratricopeptide repeat protein [Mangrovimicrobium sediminis]|uniref:Tetratricopeptide repeat protein n=1 Tax=Mangrovimicrobium sediminis TaxID=2562682 RepID=A0A4Z0LZ60_9GAMM|nr:tetratricopeptide repeat protein [Haliea sp. SAOS-164]TGD72447.1 tetratricopeptide repeat protein [Haliea sp. SAOS-164]